MPANSGMIDEALKAVGSSLSPQDKAVIDRLTQGGIDAYMYA